MRRTLRLVLAAVALVLAAGPLAVPAATPQARPDAKRYQRFRFERYALEYPATYTPQPLAVGDPGGFFTSTDPFGFLFAVMSRRGEDTVIPQGRGLANAMLDRLGRGERIVSENVSEIPPGELPPRTTVGKALDAVTEQGLRLHAGFYLTELDGRKVLVGYATLTADSVRPELRNLLTPDPSVVEGDFRHMLESLHVM